MARTAVVAGTATAVSNRVSRRQADRWQTQADADAYQQQQAYGAPPPQYQQAPPQYQQAPPAPPPPAAAPPPVVVVQQPAAEAAAPMDTSAKLAQLQQLGDLKAQGILTEAEFEAQKAKILAG
ncbi:MAG TPA: SHOCT domain-containing protein [Dongiaceae bacterium]|jgi:hypothetical protein